MSHFRCVAIPTETAARWRATGRDDRGQALHQRVVDGPGFPCRHCLELGAPGEAMLLGSYDLPHPQGVTGPLADLPARARLHPFRHADEIAPVVLANGMVSVRSYDAAELCLYESARSARAARWRRCWRAPWPIRARASSISTPRGRGVC